MKTILLLSSFLFAFGIFAQDSVSVLFIGNSYTYVNDLPTVFSNLTLSLGDEATIDSKTNGGFTFQNHLVDPLTHTKIQSKPWDFVVLQGQSQEPSFPTDQVNASTLPPAVSLADSVYKNWECSQALYYMSWGRQVGDPQWDSINTFDKMNSRLRNAYLRITDSAQASVSPVGMAWKYIRDTQPTINLYNADGSHPSLEGTYLAACTFYASVFRKPSLGASYTGGLSIATAAILQAAADLTVLDSLEQWHLRPKDAISIADFHFVASGTNVQFVNDSWRSTDYSWDFGDGFTSVLENPTHFFAADGTYSVQLISSNSCGDDTLTLTISVGNLNVESIIEKQFVLKSLEGNVFEVTSEMQLDINDIQITDGAGQILSRSNVLFLKNEGSVVQINLNGMAKGLYFLKIKTLNGLFEAQLPKLF